jgi:HD-GYP domain-containing protein (c-di-GMP phosphodiesterase class II)
MFFDEHLQRLQIHDAEATEYDPRLRPWYQQTLASPAITGVDPYLYFFLRKIGITVGKRSDNLNGVIAADIALDTLSTSLAQQQPFPGTVMALVDQDGRVLAYPDIARVIHQADDESIRIATLGELDNPVLSHIAAHHRVVAGSFGFDISGESWRGTFRPVRLMDDMTLYLVVAISERELLVDAITIRNQSALIAVLLLLIALPVAWWFSHMISVPLRNLAGDAESIQQFDFSRVGQTRSFITEINDLSRTMAMMKQTIVHFIELITSLAGERDFDQMLKTITSSTRRISGAQVAGIYLLRDKDNQLHSACVEVSLRGNPDKVRYPRNLPAVDLINKDNLLVQVFQQGKKRSFSHEFLGSTGVFDTVLRTMGSEAMQGLAIPLCNRKEEVIGVLFLGLEGKLQTLDTRWQGFVEALSGFAAVSMESRQLIQSQKDLLAAFIQLIASAIDAKSPYTGSHCQRVPELTKMLARAACESDDPEFADFDLSEDQWEELHLAAWLHDCGKVTTPEFVVDKATKLETIYDRIHEVRTRFEVLKRDATIDYWREVAGGGAPDALQQVLSDKLHRLDDDFAFVAECNLGGEFMSAQALERLRDIGAKTWQRTIDNTLGVSWSERERMPRDKPTLPVTETLLADKPEHVIPLDAPDESVLAPGNPWGFKMDEPGCKYNRGELYNLSVERGTLSAEERHKIDHHIVQTIIMLEALPYPRHLKNVPAIAGGHHEKMDGTGYPRRLTREEMPLTARMMAIADIFEALTAADRPYKKAKTLSASIAIMASMSQNQHIDPVLFRLFLRSGVYRDYADAYLAPEQIDDVDLSRYL